MGKRLSRRRSRPLPPATASCPALSQQTAQHPDQLSSRSAQFVAVVHGEFREDLIALGSQRDGNLPPIHSIALSFNEPALGGTVHQFDRAVMAYLQSFRKHADRRLNARLKPANGEKQLVLLGIDTSGLRSLLAEAQEPAYLVPELSQRAVIDCGPLPCHAAVFYPLTTRFRSNIV